MPDPNSQDQDQMHLLLGNRAACYLELNQPEPALEDAETALSLRGDWWKAHARRGKALMMLSEAFDEDNFVQAAASFQSAAELVPSSQAAERNSLLALQKKCVRKAKQMSSSSSR